ncbi:hypothetical protein LARV_02572 [Longilinea arvoryzae]|uniref:Uncharacterized protein n=1 Tax=Longilinea arvoryzae TaxID=360412 RepID=A0A0S7BAT2_9CHLR|nr:hypothetical protein LARV_02572 [Longilinea arvoryzae]
MDERPGCLSGLLKLTLLNWIFDWLQRTFGLKSGSCLGCGCGLVLFVIFIILALSIIFGTDWFRLVMEQPLVQTMI